MTSDTTTTAAETAEEQVPLTEVPATEDAPAAAEEPKPKKNWFTWGKKKTEANVENGGEPAAEGEESGEPKKTKTCWWKKTCNKNKGEDEQKQDSIAIGIDLVNRDANSINQHVHHAFDDVFGEPDSQHSWDAVWRLNHTVFTATRLFVYRLVSLLALPFTLLFAILFGLAAAVNVFVIVPLGTLLSIPGNLLAKVWRWAVHAVFDPIASALGLIFSSFTIRKYGINQETTAPCV